MANSPICRTKIVTISILNEVVMVLLSVLVAAKSHNVVALYSPQIRKQDILSTGRSYHGNSSLFFCPL